MTRISLLLVLYFFIPAAFGQQTEIPYVILVSFDGFRPDYVEKFDLPNFRNFIRDGASAEGLIPSFPSKTFPNHYTLVTGLYPGHHGLVDNGFFDPDKEKLYTMRIREAVTDASYYGGTPLWVLARKHGLHTASYFWVGSEVKETALRPDYYYDYNQSVPFGQRVDQVIRWLNLPEKERPRLITLYFSSPDTESHQYGPFAPETKQAVLQLDSLLGSFMQRIDSTRLPVNVVLVSDHGMLQLTEKVDTYIFLDNLVRNKEGSVTVVNGGTQAHVYTTTEQKRDSLYALLKAGAVNYSVTRRKDFPSQWHYDHDRSGDLLIVANPGKYIVTGDPEKFKNSLHEGASFGVHGYDPDVVPEMNGIFYAKGPNIKPGSNVPAFRNIHVYPLIAEILRLKIPPIDGRFKVLKPVYRR